MDPLVDVNGVLPGHHLVDGRSPLLLLAAFLCRSHLNTTEKHPCIRQIHTPITFPMSHSQLLHPAAPYRSHNSHIQDVISD